MGKKGYKHLTLTDRFTIERMLLKGFTKKEIADAIGCCFKTIYNEIKRATYEHTLTDLTTVTRYSPELAERRYREKLKAKGKKPKLLSDEPMRKYVETMILDYKYSPTAILHQIKNDGLTFSSDVKSVTTIYTGIKRGFFNEVKMEHLPCKGVWKKQKKKRVKAIKSAPKGTSIEKRDESILDRIEFGNWEMDSVIGKSVNRKTLLVLTERKTRFEIIEVMKEHTSLEVVRALNRIEKRFGNDFFKIFKTITVDNGSEFKDYEGMEKAVYRVGKRTKVYYCHPHAPHERGSNENANRLIRRFFSKSEDFDKTLKHSKVKEVEEWINLYPRSVLNGSCAFDLFIKELTNLNCKLRL